MRFLIQRVSEASVTIEGQEKGRIGQGFLIFIGVCESDTKETADRMLKKALQLRLFRDKEGKTNLSLKDVGGSLLLVSQFTLYADCRKGNRPSFIKSGSPAHAEALYDYIVQACRQQCENVQTGSFGAAMEVSLTNDGPFTIMLDSAEL